MNADPFNKVYAEMWEEFGQAKSDIYIERKFSLENRVGLTNFIREQRIVEYALSVPHSTVLDIGCASGHQVFALAPHCEAIMGVDIAQAFIQECDHQRDLRNCRNASFAVADFTALPTGPFAMVLCAEVLEHVLDLPESLQAIRSVLASDGHVLISVPHYNADGTWWGRVLRFLRIRSFHPLTDFSLQGIRNHGDAHVREFSRASLAQALQKEGFTVRCICTVSHLDGPVGDRVMTLFLHRVPWTRPIFLWTEHLLQRLLPGCGRHIVVLAQRF